MNQGRKRHHVRVSYSMRDVLDLLRRPDRWPLVAEYLAGHGGKRWRELLDSETSTYGRDFELLLEAVADLPLQGEDDRSPLPLLLFLWISETAHTWREIGLTPSSGRERLVRALLAAIGRAAPLGQPDQDDWSPVKRGCAQSDCLRRSCRPGRFRSARRGSSQNRRGDRLSSPNCRRG